MENKTKFYITRDIAESAALLASGQHLLQIDRKGKTCWFVFEDFLQCQQISDDYFFGELKVNAREFHQSFTRLKNRIFAGT